MELYNVVMMNLLGQILSGTLRIEAECVPGCRSRTHVNNIRLYLRSKHTHPIKEDEWLVRNSACVRTLVAGDETGGAPTPSSLLLPDCSLLSLQHEPIVFIMATGTVSSLSCPSGKTI